MSWSFIGEVGDEKTRPDHAEDQLLVDSFSLDEIIRDVR